MEKREEGGNVKGPSAPSAKGVEKTWEVVQWEVGEGKGCSARARGALLAGVMRKKGREAEEVRPPA